MNLLNVLLIIGVVLPSVAYLLISFLIMKDHNFSEIFLELMLTPIICLCISVTPYIQAVFIPAAILLIMMVHTKMNSELWYYRILKPLFVCGNVMYLCFSFINFVTGGTAF